MASSVLLFLFAGLRLAKVGEEILKWQAGFPEGLETIGTVDLCCHE
jgi:hypothetical protein